MLVIESLRTFERYAIVTNSIRIVYNLFVYFFDGGSGATEQKTLMLHARKVGGNQIPLQCNLQLYHS